MTALCLFRSYLWLMELFIYLSARIDDISKRLYETSPYISVLKIFPCTFFIAEHLKLASIRQKHVIMPLLYIFTIINYQLCTEKMPSKNITAQLHQLTSRRHLPRNQFSILRLAGDRVDMAVLIKDDSFLDTGRGKIRRVACRFT
jgi:hypothetical protein